MTDKEMYLFRFPTQRQADYWMRKTYDAFTDEVVKVDKHRAFIEFEFEVYYFWSVNRVNKLVANRATCYGPEDLYIILDDPERKRLDTYTPTTLDIVK